VGYNYVQTDRVELIDEPTKYMLDEMVQANIVLKKAEAEQEAQTTIKEFVDENISTEMVSVVNRGFQFPEEVVRAVSEGEAIDLSFQYLFEKLRNLVDRECYSIDRFEGSATKYKLVGRANLSDDLKKRLFVEALVFSQYNYYGLK
jgi:SHS2 domain-containing protein